MEYGTQNVSQQLDELATNIQQMHGLVIEVERYDKRIGTTQDTEDLWNELTTVHSNFQRKVNRCQELVHQVSYLKGLSKYQSIQTSRLKNDLKEVVSWYTRIQKQISSRERGVIRRSRQKSLESLPTRDDDPMLMQCQLDGQEILEREQHIRQIEDDMVSVAGIMQQINYMVHDQGETVDNIEANVSQSAAAAKESTMLLGQADKYAAKTRKRNCCIITTFIILLLIIVLIIVLSGNSKK